jgi:NADH:ubiquinone oxidoreductase subunit F (NADH-binding)
VEKKGAQRSSILELLEHHPELSAAAVQEVSEQSGVPAADVYGAGSFYELLEQQWATARVCTGLTCRIEGGDALKAQLEAGGESVVSASCVGWCDRAPVALGADLRVRWGSTPRGGLTPANPALAIDLSGEDNADYEALTLAGERGEDFVLQHVAGSGLQGRGGAGFPAHIKWRGVRSAEVSTRYVVVNADEAEPATFKDRATMIQRPHRVIEGAAIAARTVGAEVVYLYVRGEFPDARAALERAVEEAGAHLDGLTFRFVSGHGAYICGEETALLESIEGKRGMPRLKPPYPTQVGLFGKPTLVHNVETLACLPSILLRTGEWFAGQGRTEAGSKLYCISGHVQRPGVYELPLGVCLDELVEAAGGYRGSPMAFSPGGASSGFLPISERKRPLDFRSLKEVGSMLGSAGVVVLDDSVDLAWAALQQAVFFEHESCGQCTPCRVGTRVVRMALERYLDEGDPGLLKHIPEIAWELQEGSICGLGHAAALPVETLARHFPNSLREQR